MAELLELGNIEERKQKAAQILQILKPLSKNDSIFHDNYDETSSNNSDIQNPFSDDEDQMAELSGRKKRMSKIDTNIYLMGRFTKEHRKIEEELREQMNKTNSKNNICTEDLSKCDINPLDTSDDEEFLNEAKEILLKSGLDAREKEKAEKEHLKNLKNKNKKPQQQQQQAPPPPQPAEDEIETNSLSGIWRMLDGESMKNGFPITEIGYNLFEDKRLEWLNREDVAWDDKEQVKMKCDQWLKKCKLLQFQ